MKLIMKILTLYLLLLLMLPFENLSSQDFAQNGTWEAGGRLNYTNTTIVRDGESSGNSLSILSLDVPAYYFVSDGLSLGLIPGFEYIGPSSETYLLTLLAGLAYNIKIHTTAYPFIEGRFGYNTSSSSSGMVWIITGGLKAKVGGNALLVLGLFYEQRTLGTSGNQGGRNGTNSWGLDVGFSIFFW